MRMEALILIALCFAAPAAAQDSVKWVSDAEAAASPKPDFEFCTMPPPGHCPPCENVKRLLRDPKVIKWSKQFDCIQRHDIKGSRPPSFPYLSWTFDNQRTDRDNLLGVKPGWSPKWTANDLAWEFARAHREFKRKTRRDPQ
jgi:hypothetical protein